MTDNSYTAKDIQVLEGIEAVRRRPGMYIGGTGLDGLHHLVWEVISNSIDEAMMGYAKNIRVKLLPNNKVEISDDGRGIPVDIHPKTKKSALETVLTVLHAGGKFSQKIYRSVGGLHGVGISVVNALSKELKAIVKRDGFIWSQEYKRGIPTGPVKRGKPTKETGTTIIFEPDPQIFQEIKFDRKRILEYLRHQAYLTPKLRIVFIDEREKEPFIYSFYFEHGLESFLKHILLNHKPILEKNFFLSIKEENYELEVAFTYLEENQTIEYTFTNNILNPDGGTHLTGFRSALVKVFNQYGKKENLIKSDDVINVEDIRGGLVAIISLRIPEPQFEGQTKTRLGNPEVKSLVEKLVSGALLEFLEKESAIAKKIIQRVLLNTEARKAAKAAKEAVFKKKVKINLTLSGKLADCSNRDPNKRELFIVEGDSAGGSAKQGRDRASQAVLPLRGKILNVEKARLDKILKSEEIKALIMALGTGFGKDFNLENLRYSKIIIASDADSDGNHIRTLILTLFYRYFRPLIENGFVYIAQPPLYKIQAGKEVYYAYSDEEKNKIIKEKLSGKKFEVQRYKGLGEMNPEELWETTMNPEKRILKQITLKDAEEADRLFTILMGTDIASRRQYIETYARQVQNLDI
jgi:DNA gyrase subunit B